MNSRSATSSEKSLTASTSPNRFVTPANATLPMTLPSRTGRFAGPVSPCLAGNRANRAERPSVGGRRGFPQARTPR